MISYLFPIFAQVRPSTEHALIAYYPHSKVVDSYSVVLTTHNLRSYIIKALKVTHVSRSSWSVFSIIWVPHSSNTQIRDPHVSYIELWNLSTVLIKD